MGYTCIIKNCKPPISCKLKTNLFRFPKDPDRCRRWMWLIGYPELQHKSMDYLYKRKRICSIHFEPEMFAGMSRTRLKKDAEPSLFLPKIEKLLEAMPGVREMRVKVEDEIDEEKTIIQMEDEENEAGIKIEDEEPEMIVVKMEEEEKGTENVISEYANVYQLPLPQNQLEQIVQNAKDWALVHGITMRTKTTAADSVMHTPFVVPPSPFPRTQFDKAVDIQLTFNELIHRVAHDDEFLRASLKETVEVDAFTGSLFKIYETVLAEGRTQNFMLGLLRSDYMVHKDDLKIRQVEINTIASSFGGLATQMSQMNRYILGQLGYTNEVPKNTAVQGLSNGMYVAWQRYGVKEASILFVVENDVYNICDQRFLEYELFRLQSDIKVIRMTLTEVEENAQLNSDKELVIDGSAVAVVYFRAGYEPNHYPTQKEWDARLTIERSRAIKCPSIEYHLAGTKKIQQMLASSDTLQKYLGDARKVARIKDVMTGLYSLSGDELGNRTLQMALANPEKFVLKPQREGGGNNVYGATIKDSLLRMQSTNELSAWILMELIVPPISKGYIVRAGQHAPELADIVSELGIFGVILGDANEIVVNEQVGHMLRSKVSTENEGGVAVGVGALDSPYLIHTS